MSNSNYRTKPLTKAVGYRLRRLPNKIFDFVRALVVAIQNLRFCKGFALVTEFANYVIRLTTHVFLKKFIFRHKIKSIKFSKRFTSGNSNSKRPKVFSLLEQNLRFC